MGQEVQVAAEAHAPRSMVEVIANAVMDPRVDPEKMERLFALQEKVLAREAEAAFNVAMTKAQSEMGRISADKTNSQTSSAYASYGQLDRALRPVYTDNGFSLSFDTEPAAEGMVGVKCYVSHDAGHTRTYRAMVPSDGKGARGNDVMTKTHAFGSGASYGMRYLLKMIFNVAIGEDDDDGNGANGTPTEYVTEKQAAEMRDIIEGAGLNAKKFLDWLKVDSLEMIPAHAHKVALDTLKAQAKGKGHG